MSQAVNTKEDVHSNYSWVIQCGNTVLETRIAGSTDHLEVKEDAWYKI